jgi:hypothetical protein
VLFKPPLDPQEDDEKRNGAQPHTEKDDSKRDVRAKIPQEFGDT